jgi:alpha-L-fucosidase
MKSKKEYEQDLAASRDQRMQWWREARYGLFIHYGLYSQTERQEWVMAYDNIPISEYEKLAHTFQPKEGCCREWISLAKAAGMKYAVLTTRHHEGFSLWDSKANPYNSVNLGPKRDLVAEFVQACREQDMRIGFYSSLMDWHHPDSWRCAFDNAARQRFLQYIEDLNVELLSNYGKIDILWYDVPQPLESHEGWNSLERNQKLRALQPDILINDRSRLDEDFGTPEEQIKAADREWEACMTFNGLSWGYIDSEQARPYSYNAQQILRMLRTCCAGGGNLLLNIGPTPDGSVPMEAIEPLHQVGAWLRENGEAVYGRLEKRRTGIDQFFDPSFEGNILAPATRKQNTIYLWNTIWPQSGEIHLGGYSEAPKKVTLLKDGTSLSFEHKGHRLRIYDLPEERPDTHCGVTVIAVEFDPFPAYRFASYYPQLNHGTFVTDPQ